MSFVHHEASPKRIAANQGNAQKSTGPKTPEVKARASLNSIKHGAFAKAENCRRQIMLRLGEDSAHHEQLHQDVMDSLQPDDALQALVSQGVGGQAMVVNTIVDRTWGKLQVQSTFLENQLVLWAALRWPKKNENRETKPSGALESRK